MAKNVSMKKGETIVKCSEDHIDHFEKMVLKWLMKNQLLKKLKNPKKKRRSKWLHIMGKKVF